MSEFLQISFDLGTLAADSAEQACLACGASAITFADARDEPVLEPAPGEFRLWSSTRLQALFAPGTPPAATVRALSAALGVNPGQLEVRRLADRVWEREWLRDFHAMRFGRRLWICPHHAQVEDPEAAVVRLDPGLAFGTGTHPTTALCLEWLDAHPPLADEVIDYGCGSGILALAAARLGARRVQCLHRSSGPARHARQRRGERTLLAHPAVRLGRSAGRSRGAADRQYSVRTARGARAALRGAGRAVRRDPALGAARG